VKSIDAHALRVLLVARSRLVSERQARTNTICGLLKDLWDVGRKRQQGLLSAVDE
jgi:hypothetical protein